VQQAAFNKPPLLSKYPWPALAARKMPTEGIGFASAIEVS